MNRLRLLPSLFAFLLPLAACDKLTDTSDPADAEPTVSVVLSTAEIHPSDAPDYTMATVIAKAPAQGMSLSAMILDATGKVATDQFITSFSPMPGSSDSTFSTSSWKITTKSTTSEGTYSLKVIVTDKKGRTSSQVANFRVSDDAKGPSDEIRIEGWTDVGTVNPFDPSSPGGLLYFDNAPVDISVRILTSSGSDVSDDFTVIGDSRAGTSPYPLSNIEITNSGAPAGEYVLVISLTDGKGKSTEKRANFTAETFEGDPGDFEWLGTRTLGAQGSSFASFLQIQGGALVPWTSSAPNRPFDKIDLVVGLDETGTLSMMSPNQANGDGFNLSSWPARNSTELLGLGTEFPTSLLDVQTLLDDGGYAGNPEKLEILEGHYYAARLSSGEVVVLQVDAVSGFGNKMEVELSVYH